MFKKIAMTLFTGVAALTLAACGSSSNSANLEDAIKEKGKLVVATSPDYAPFEFKALIDGKDTVVGADISLAQLIADELGVELEISAMNFDNVLTSVKTGKADIAISGLSYTEDRAKSFDFSISYYQSQNAILAKEDVAAGFKEIADLAGKKVAVQRGSIQEDLAKAQLGESNIVSLTNLGEAVNELKSGQVDAVLLDEAVATGYANQNSDLALAEVAVQTDEDDSNAIVMPKDSPELKATIDAIVEKVVADGKYGEFLIEADKLTENAIEE